MKTARIYTNDFNRIISATKAFISSDTRRIEANYIKLEFNADESIVTATAIDGCRVSVEHSVISNCDENFTAYIKPNVKLPNRSFAEFILDGVDSDELIIRCNGFIFGYTQPKIKDRLDTDKIVQNIISKKPNLRITFNGNYLLSALQAAKASAGDSFRNPVVFEFTTPIDPVVIKTNKADVKIVLPMRTKTEEENKQK